MVIRYCHNIILYSVLIFCHIDLDLHHYYNFCAIYLYTLYAMSCDSLLHPQWQFTLILWFNLLGK